VPNNVINDFANALGLEINTDMDVDDSKRKVKGFDGIRNKVNELMKEGYSASQVLTQVNLNTISVLRTIDSLPIVA
jgi:replication factor C subunit 2/4